jgi:hypothetical protein
MKMVDCHRKSLKVAGIETCAVFLVSRFYRFEAQPVSLVGKTSKYY